MSKYERLECAAILGIAVMDEVEKTFDELDMPHMSKNCSDVRDLLNGIIEFAQGQKIKAAG